MANGVSIESVTKMLGHTNVQMPRHYARILDCTIIHETSQIKVNAERKSKVDDNTAKMQSIKWLGV